MKYEIVKEYDEDLRSGLAKLLPQLKPANVDLSNQYFTRIISSDAVDLFIAKNDDGQVLGMLSLIIYPVPTGVRARIEDVVVDVSVRRTGVAATLINQAMKKARAKGADGVALTSNPRRTAANKLYRKIGFLPWETNVYFYRFV